MATIIHLSLLLFFTVTTLSVHATPNIDSADHLAVFKILKGLGVTVELHRPDNLCNTAGISCEPRISKEAHILKVTRIVFKTQRLRGFLSPAIGQLSELKELSFPNNYLVDRIPPQIADCRKLEILQLRNNKLSGDVPGELSSLIHLRILDLSSNMFSGDLSFINYFPNLEKLSLDNNMFTGNAPVSLPLFRNLRYCNISGNSLLRGPLPTLNQLESSSPELKKTNPKRYIFAESTNSSTIHQIGYKSSSSNSSPAPSPTKTPNSKHRKKIKTTILVVIIAAGVISATIFLSIYIYIVRMKKIRRNKAAWRSIRQPILSMNLSFLHDHEAVAALQVIGRGGCGVVFRREILHENIKTIAIKTIIKPPKDLLMHTREDTLRLNKIHQIKSEIETAGVIRHRNLLPLLAHVKRSTCHYLVYRFMQNGSLQDVIQQVNNGTRELDWLAMHRIAIGIAHGMEYLHTSLTPRIVHRDLKPANILIDDNMEPVITDFGLAKFIPDTLTHMSSKIAGTLGFIAPEYHQTMQFTDKCDIYSYGVLLGYLVIGKLPSDEFFQETSEMSMVRWLRMLVTRGNPENAINPKLAGKGFDAQMILLLKIAFFCTRQDPQDRPTSKDCRIMLSQISH